MRSRSKLSQLWISLLVVLGVVAVAGPVGATPIHRDPGFSHRARLDSPGLPRVYSHSFLGLGPLSGEIVRRHVPNGLAIGWHRRHDGGTLSSPVSDGPITTADTTADNTSPAIPEPSAALLFGAGTLLVSNALRRRKPVA